MATQTQTRAKPGTSRLSEVARHVVRPEGIVGTDWLRVCKKCLEMGIGFDAWQDGAGRLILAKREDGTYAADTVALSIPRQVGKTYLIAAVVFALCLMTPRTLALWTAHRYATAEDTFNDIKAMIERSPKLARQVSKVYDSAGKQRVILNNGSRLVFGARERGFGRGFKKVGILVFDEAQILSQRAVDDMVPTTNATTNPLIIYMGTPPTPIDPGEVFADFRERAISGESEDVLYIEFSADRGADPLDRRQWARANPSYPHRTSERSVLRMLKNLTRDSFMREALGVWDETTSVIDFKTWAELADPDSAPADTQGVCFAVDMPPDRSSVTIALAGDREDGSQHIEIVACERGTAWIPAKLTDLVEKYGPCAVILDAGSPAGSLLPALADAGIETVNPSAREVGQATGLFTDSVAERSIRHRSDPLIDAALRAAKKRKLGDSWTWDRRDLTDISPLVAANLALWGFAVYGRDAAPNIW